MIKRIIACLTICLIITGLISPVFSDASALPQPNWSDPGISEIINISDLTGWMLNGGTYDVSTYTDAESFMNDYFAARTKTRLEGSDYQIKSSFGLEQQYYQVGDSAYAHPLDVNRVIASSYRDHSGYGRRLSNEVNDALLSSGSLYDTKIPLLNEIEFANFVGYNHDALNLYAAQFINSDSPNPDPEYDWFSSNVNNLYIKGYQTNPVVYSLIYDLTNYYISNDSYSLIPVKPLSQYSFIFNNGVNYHNPSNNTSNWFEGNISDIITINIDNSNQDSVNVTYENINYNSFYSIFTAVNGYNGRGDYNFLSMSFTPSYKPGSSGLNSFQQTDLSFIQNNFTSLNQALNYIFQHYSNINLYVDGSPWVLAGINSTNTITPEFPDAVGGEDLSSTTWPIFRPRAPYYTSVPGVLQAIEDAIADDGELDIDDLKPYLTDENGDPVPDPEFDPEPVPIPVPDPVNTDVVPGLPVLPAIPPEMPGFNGVSVLAEIINFTNQSLPTALIVTFWGIVFGIVILGLIKILHK